VREPSLLIATCSWDSTTDSAWVVLHTRKRDRARVRQASDPLDWFVKEGIAHQGGDEEPEGSADHEAITTLDDISSSAGPGCRLGGPRRQLSCADDGL